ncbi:hypothetical protein GQX74_014404 [Glossina fuscipes]|nr:hypothetical protein GQX74_014404 [Glossina fuscipes]
MELTRRKTLPVCAAFLKILGVAVVIVMGVGEGEHIMQLEVQIWRVHKYILQCVKVLNSGLIFNNKKAYNNGSKFPARANARKSNKRSVREGRNLFIYLTNSALDDIVGRI